MNFAKVSSDAATELEFFHKFDGEITTLEQGDRVYFLTVGGDYPGEVNENWSPTGWPSAMVSVTLDCRPDRTFELHRTMFRAFTALDHIARV